MSVPILDLGNAANFQVIYETLLVAPSVVQGYYTPIGQHSIPTIFNSHTLLVGASSSTAKPNWRLGFYLSMLIVSGVGTAEVEQKRIPFGLSLIRFPVLSSQFRLRVYVPRWHKEMEMKIWEYTGSVEDIDAIMNRIESRIIALAGQLINSSFKSQSTFISPSNSSFTGLI